MGMGILGYLVLGLIAGAIAKAIMPGKQGGGWLSTLIIGVIGAVLGGVLGGLLTGVNPVSQEGFWNIWSWLAAIIGALIVLFIWGLIKGRGARA